jgi:hypothetical protein
MEDTMKSKMMLIVLSMVAIGFFASCEKKGTAEKAGEKIDEAVDKVQQKAEDAGKDIKESVTE